jgi:hypothetical protein
VYERLERLREREPRPSPLAEAQDELEQQVHEHLARDGHAQLAAIGEVERTLTPGLVTLLEHHLLARTVQGAPLVHPSLQCPKLAGSPAIIARPLELAQDRRRLQDRVGVGHEQRHDLGFPDAGERIRTCAPRSRLLRRAR